MSFLGAIGNLMAGSGLKEVLELTYAENAVSHMFTKKSENLWDNDNENDPRVCLTTHIEDTLGPTEAQLTSKYKP